MALPAILAVISAVSSLLNNDKDEKKTTEIEKLGDVMNTSSAGDAVKNNLSKNMGTGSTNNFGTGVQTAQTIGSVLNMLDSENKKKQPYYYGGISTPRN